MCSYTISDFLTTDDEIIQQRNANIQEIGESSEQEDINIIINEVEMETCNIDNNLIQNLTEFNNDDLSSASSDYSTDSDDNFDMRIQSSSRNRKIA